MTSLAAGFRRARPPAPPGERSSQAPCRAKLIAAGSLDAGLPGVRAEKSDELHRGCDQKSICLHNRQIYCLKNKQSTVGSNSGRREPEFASASPDVTPSVWILVWSRAAILPAKVERFHRRSESGSSSQESANVQRGDSDRSAKRPGLLRRDAPRNDAGIYSAADTSGTWRKPRSALSSSATRNATSIACSALRRGSQ